MAVKKQTKILLIAVSIVLIFIFIQGFKKANGPASELTILGQDIGEFSTIDLAGEAVTNEVFSGYDVNMVYLWSTG